MTLTIFFLAWLTSILTFSSAQCQPDKLVIVKISTIAKGTEATIACTGLEQQQQQNLSKSDPSSRSSSSSNCPFQPVQLPAPAFIVPVPGSEIHNHKLSPRLHEPRTLRVVVVGDGQDVSADASQEHYLGLGRRQGQVLRSRDSPATATTRQQDTCETGGPVNKNGPSAPPAPAFFLVTFSMISFQAAILHLYGQPTISKSGIVKFWDGDVLGPENSQQLTDWYTFSHIIHGFIFYGVLSYATPEEPIQERFLIALSVEIGWELLENSPMVIKRYRNTALAQGYSGDSIINSVSDSLAMCLGFTLAHVLPTGLTVTLAIVMELTVGILIHDNLTLNIIQLIHPFPAISQWQLNLSSKTNSTNKN